MHSEDRLWLAALSAVTDGSRLATGDQLGETVDRAVRPVGLRAQVLVVDLAQRALTAVRPGGCDSVAVEGTLAGRAYQWGAFVAGTEDSRPVGGEAAGPARLLWVPMLDGTERVGVLRLVLDDPVIDDAEFRARCWTLAGLVGHIVMTKIVYSDHLRRLRSGRPLTTAAELLWHLVPPRTFATERVSISALLEPHDRVAGDAYDYSATGDILDLAVYDGVGHDLSAGLATTLAVSTVRAARRAGPHDLTDLADLADLALRSHSGVMRFVTAILARLDTRTGTLHYLLAGHPRPLLIRSGHIVKELDAPVQRPLGVTDAHGRRGPGEERIGHEQLEPGDRLLFYSDGVVEARDREGTFFGVRRLVDLTERAEQAQVSPAETLRRLTASVMAHQDDQLQDDATLLMLDWSAGAHELLLPARA